LQVQNKRNSFFALAKLRRPKDGLLPKKKKREQKTKGLGQGNNEV
jgi:hypothetical protein